MTQPYNIGNLKAYQPMPRASYRPAEIITSKGKARQSEPPMYSNDFDFSAQASKSSKDFTALNSPYTNKLYKPFQSKIDPSNRQGVSAHSIPQPHDIHRQGIQPLYSDQRQPQQNMLNKLQQQVSPKTESSEWTTKYSSGNRTMPLASSGNKIDKQAYLNKIQPIRTSGGHNETLLKKTVVDMPSHDNTTLPFSSKLLSDGSENPFNKSPTQTSPIRKAPRQSQPVYQQGYDDDMLTNASTASGSPIQNSSAIRLNLDPRFMQQRSADEYKYGSRPQPTEGNYDADLFKKQKDFRDVPNTNNFTTLQAFKTNMRKSEFRMADFIKGRELGSGKFGKVQVVKHKKTGFICAMKTVPKAVIREENIINQFIRELKIQSCLDHPNVTKLYGFFDDKDNIYLLLELGSEGQLYRVIKERKRLSENTCSYIMKQICQALKYLHSLNILHRDIKPQNIVITYNTIKLCDFGWAVNKGSELRSTFCGTPLYVSPEILKGQMYDEKIDVWSVGILTYELLVGDIPFQISSQQELIKIIKEDIVFPKDILISDQAKDFILKILKKNPDDRVKIEKLLEHPFLQRNVDSSQIEL